MKSILIYIEESEHAQWVLVYEFLIKKIKNKLLDHKNIK